jgi:hypothetical protein
MFIRTRPSTVGISLEARVPSEDFPATQETVSFELTPTEERDHLDLDTGEVFQNYSYARIHKNEKKLIGANITVRPILDDSDYQYNAMQYFSEQTGVDFHSPASIHFSVFIEPTVFRELAGNIRGGLYPEAITIELPTRPKTAIEFGREPDGSGMIWHNTEKENRRIAIKSIRFDYAVVKARYDEKQVDRPLPMQFNAADRINERIALIQTNLAEMLKYT